MAFRRKRKDTKVSTIEAMYGVDFRVRGDMKLGTLYKRTGTSNIKDLVAYGRSHGELWRATEKAACRRRGMTHVGGSGQPDCSGSGKVVEVKDHSRPVGKSKIREIAGKPWASGKSVEVVAPGGFTDAARQEARRRGMKLSSR